MEISNIDNRCHRAEEKSHGYMDLSNKTPSLETDEDGLNLDNSNLWEML